MPQTNSKVRERSDIKLNEPKRYNVVLYNDDFTTMEFVVMILTVVFRLTEEKANAVMMKVHKEGKGIAGTYSYDIALTRQQKAMSLAKQNGFPLKIKVEEE